MSLPVSVGQTDFPLRPSAADRAPLSPLTGTGAPFRLLDGPPYANGAPHLGHVLNKHLKDALARAADASGLAVEWRPGWDCHGLPLELAVEKLGVRRTDRAAFVAAARNFATEQVALQRNVFEQQGWSAQFDRPWHTQDPEMEAGTLRVLADLLDKGLLDVRFAAVPWCPKCASTLSGAEQEDAMVTQMAWTVPFQLESGEALLSWTTTPWTLPLNRALVLSPEARYVALEKDGARAWVSEATSEAWAAKLGAVVTADARLGQDFAGQAYATPFAGGQVATDELVVAEAGTGVLHAVPGLSELDTLLGRRHGWDVRQHLSVHGKVQLSPLPAQNDLVAGPAASEVVRAFYAASPWFAEEVSQVEGQHCWRHHAPLLTRASRQVFLRLDDAVRQSAAAMVERCQFTPAAARQRLETAMRTRPDWCLSRQRTWGVPLALFLDPATGQPHARASEWMRAVADSVAQEGVEAWWASPTSRWTGDEDVERVDDVLDVWFDSGCVPQLVGAADVVAEGTDQFRGWFQSCLWVAAALEAPAPFKHVVVHGFVVDKSGDKLSKSKGGDAVAKGQPCAPWHTLPTDVVRLWALSGGEGADKAWTRETVQGAEMLMSRLRGLVRFMLANALPAEAVAASASASAAPLELPAWDAYWVEECRRVSTEAVRLLASAHAGQAVELVREFGDAFSSRALASWKDRLYCAPASTQERQLLDAALRACLQEWSRVLRVLTPRLMNEARSCWPAGALPALAPLSPQGREEVLRVLALRDALAPTAELLAQHKGGSGRRRLAGWTGAPAWPGQLLSDALDVGQCGDEVPGMLVLETSLPGAARVALGLSPDPTCPRCRRAQAQWSGEVCVPCAERSLAEGLLAPVPALEQRVPQEAL